MRNHEELVPLNELPVAVPNIGQICGYVGDPLCQAAADFSIWADFGVTRHRWIESRPLCRNHADLDGLEYFEQALPLTQYARALVRSLMTNGGSA